MEADASTLDMPSDCCYFVEKAAAAGAAPAFQYFDSIFHHFAVVTQNLGQTLFRNFADQFGGDFHIIKAFDLLGNILLAHTTGV